MALNFTIRDSSGNVVADLTKSFTKILGTMSVSSSQVVNIPEFAGQRGWAIVRGLNWNPQSGRPDICIAEVNGTQIDIRLTYGTYEIVYGIY